MSWRKGWTLPLMALLLATACNRGGGSLAPLRYDSAGVAVIRHDALSAYERKTYQPEYILTIGASERPPEQVFGEIGDAAVLSDGTLAVLDLQAAEVRLFSPNGEFVGTLGRRGQGPGELSGDGTLAVLPLPSGRIAIPDLLNQSVSVYGGATGGLLSTHRMAGGVIYLPEWRSFAGDTVLVRARENGRESILARSLDGSRSDTLVAVDQIEQRRSQADPRTPLLPDHWVWASSGAGDVAMARLTAAEVAVYRGSQLRLRMIWRATETELSDQEVDHLLDVVGRRLGAQGGEVAAMRSQVREMMAIPEAAPVLADLEFGPHGMLLVQRIRPIADMDRRILAVFRARGFGGPDWDVFSDSGEYVGVVDFGANVEVFRVQGDTIVGMREGPFGTQEAFVARLPGTLVEAAVPR